MKRNTLIMLKRIIAVILSVIMLPISSYSEGITNLVYAGENITVGETSDTITSSEEETSDITATDEESSVEGSNEISNDEIINEINENEDNDDTLSEENSEVSLLSVTGQINEASCVVLKWVALDSDDVSYRVIKNNVLIDTLTSDDIDENNYLVYKDSDTEASKTYTYYVEAVISNETVIAKSSDLIMETAEDMTISSDYTLESDLTVYSLNHTGGTIDLNGYTLTICNDYISSGNTCISFNKGALMCYGNFNINYYIGHIIMNNANDYMYVRGNIIMSNSGYNTLNNGLIEG